MARVKLEEHLTKGRRLREDGFFEVGPGGRSVAEEITEAALQSAMNSAQEKKVDFIGALIANVSVAEDIDVSNAHFIIDLAHSLTYRSFAILAIARNIDTFGFEARLGEDAPGPPADLHPLMTEVFELTRRGVIELKTKADDVSSYAVLGMDELDPAKIRLSTIGKLLHANLELNQLNTEDPVYVQTLEQLSRLSQTGQGPAILDGSTF